jgi:hypothetical protein
LRRKLETVTTMPDSNAPAGLITPGQQTADGVLSGSGWLQPQPATLQLNGIAPATLDTSHPNVLCTGGGGTEQLLYLPPAASVPVGFAFTVRLLVPIGTTFDVKIYGDPHSTDGVHGNSWFPLYGPLAYVTLVSDGGTSWYAFDQGTDAVLQVGLLGIFGASGQFLQAPLCVTLADVIAVLVSCGFCKSH